jgi:hypothetical protein
MSKRKNMRKRSNYNEEQKTKRGDGPRKENVLCAGCSRYRKTEESCNTENYSTGDLRPLREMILCTGLYTSQGDGNLCGQELRTQEICGAR